MRIFNTHILSILIGCALSLFIIGYYFSGQRHFENLAMGTHTSPYQAKQGDTIIHIQRVNEDDELAFLSHIGNKDVYLFLGNSQTHSINQKKDGQVNFIELLNNKLGSSNVAIRCNSLPNAGMQEYYLSYQYWKSKFRIKYLVIPVCMDDMREDGIRDVFYPKLIITKYQIEDTISPVAKKVNAELRAFWSTNENNKANNNDADMAALKETVQESTEKYLNDKLDSNWKLWRDRQNVRGEFFNWMYKLRNTALHINANTIRQMIPQRYEANMNALNAIVSDCIKNNTKVLLYIPPIRHDVKLPYNETDYHNFKNEIIRLADKNPGVVYYKNYEAIVPGELWGYKEATNLTDDREIDFMHFQYRGHEILADSMLHFFTTQNPMP